MFENPILITPEDYLHTMVEKDSEDFLFINPQGSKLVNEMGDVYYHKGAHVPYHEHSEGYEIFMIDRGSAQVTISGKRCTIGAGDLLHIEPYVAHQFTFLEEGTIWREVFQGMNMYAGIKEKDLVFRCFPQKLEDQEFLTAYRARKKTLRPGDIEPVDIPKEEMPAVRVKGGALRSFRFDGVTCNLKVGRWETAGESEMWEYVFDKDVAIEWTEPDPEWSLFVVREGSVEVNAATKKYIAHERDILHIPPYTRHSFKILEQGTTLHSYYCKSDMLTLLEELDLARSKDPSCMKDEAFVKGLMAKHKCYVSGFCSK